MTGITIADFANKYNEFNDSMAAAITKLQADVKLLNDKVTEFQNSEGLLSAEDQSILNALEARSSEIADKVNRLDALTPPKPPTTPTNP